MSTNPHINITIPCNLVQDFIGIVVLDILHDAKGRGFLANHKLAEITDIVAHSINFHNDNNINIISLKNIIFKLTLNYFLQLWSTNIDALGINFIPNTELRLDSEEEWKYLRDIVLLPIRSVADRQDEDAFITLGHDKYGVEAQNYANQKDILPIDTTEFLSFISPKGINKADDFFMQASGVVDIITTRTNNISKAVLDMKSAAGLIRTITDPIGYTTGLPTFADPGYNMPGMSSIRKHAHITFTGAETSGNQFYGSTEFNYCVNIYLPNLGKLVFLQTNYFYGVQSAGLDRTNVMITILGNIFKGTLPRSTTMAEALRDYLKSADQGIMISVKEIFESLWTLMSEYYKFTSDEIAFEAHGDVFNQRMQWYAKIYEIAEVIDIPEVITAEYVIENMLPEVMNEYSLAPTIKALAFCYHTNNLIREYIVTHEELEEKLDKQWLPKRKGKLTTQIEKNINEFTKNVAKVLHDHKSFVREYLQKLLIMCHTHLAKLYALINSDTDIEKTLALLHILPFFEHPVQLNTILRDYLIFNYPDLYYRTKHLTQTGLMLGILLEMTSKQITKFSINLDTVLTVSVSKDVPDYNNDEKLLNAIHNILGKFSGDFGQIMWCICYGHLFASEDNNTSAMAVLLHKLPAENIIRCKNTVWGNIHGLGDGGSVDILLHKV